MKADMILKNGRIHTMDKDGRVAEALAIQDGKILQVGSAHEVMAHAGPHTVVKDLSGGMVLPGMIDTHLHSPGTAGFDLFSITLHEVMNDLDAILGRIEDFVRKHPDDKMYFGYGFSNGAFTGKEVFLGPKKERLDSLCPDKPVFLVSYDGHMGWVNSAALKHLGITRDTPDPEGGRIERDPDTGEPWGALKESAARLMPEQDLTLDQRVEAMKLFQQRMHGWGYTGVQNMAGRDNLEELAALEKAGELKLRVRSAIELNAEADLDSEFGMLEELRNTYSSDLNAVEVAKFFADGVVEGVTGYLLEPYEEAAGRGSEYCGEFLWDMNKLKRAFVTAHEKGFQIHVHSIGDASTRLVLDALEYAASRVPGDFRPVITHLQLVAPEDIARFARLGVVASTQTGFWGFKEPDNWEVVDHAFLGTRAETEYPLQSFFNAGAVVVSSSDHPVTPIPNPLWAIRSGVTRNLNHAAYYGVEDITDANDPTWLLGPEERASLDNMIRSYTSNSAYAVFLEDSVGTLEAGKYADLVILEKDLYDTDPLEIDSVRIMATMFNGQVVFEAD